MKNKAVQTASSENEALDSRQTIHQIKKACLRLLTRRDYSQKELQNKLSTKGYSQDHILLAIEELAQEKWQDDTRYAENYARFRIQKGFGPKRIRYELRQNGIDQASVEQIIQTTSSEQLAQLKRVYDKKYADSAGVLDAKELARRSRFLLQRGFSGTHIQNLFKQAITKSA